MNHKSKSIHLLKIEYKYFAASAEENRDKNPIKFDPVSLTGNPNLSKPKKIIINNYTQKTAKTIFISPGYDTFLAP